MATTDAYLAFVKTTSEIWNAMPPQKRELACALVNNRDFHSLVLSLGVMTLEELRQGKITIGKLSIETTEVDASARNES